LNKNRKGRESRISRDGTAAAKANLRSATHNFALAQIGGMNMNRIMTALALSGLFIAAPAFAKVQHQGRKPVATAGDKAPAGEKAPAAEKAPGSETKVEKTTEGKTETTPVKKKKSSKKAEKSETSSEKPVETPVK